MAVYRSDQAQLTFATEAAQGGDPELIEGTVSGVSAALTADHSAGVRSITVDGVTGGTLVVGDFIRIGTVTAATTVAAHEVRRIEAMDEAGNNSTNTLHLDRPTAFYHANDQQVKECTAIGGDATRNDQGKMLTWIPGVYETVDTPDPEMSIEGHRFLGTESKRNWAAAYPGQQTLTGSVSGIVLLNGWPLRFPIGSVVTTPSVVTGTNTLTVDANKGDLYVTIDNSTDLAAGNFLNIDDGSTTVSEVRRLITNPASTLNNHIWKLNAPLQFAHSSGVSVKKVHEDSTYTHSIKEKVDLDTVSWHVHMKDSSETTSRNFDRRYVGGMIGSSTIAAEEGGMVTMSWDSINFLNMVHNQQNQTTLGTNLYSGASIAANMPRYGLMQPIDSDDVGPSAHGASGAPGANDGTGYPNTQPYYFSQGSIKFFGTEFARIRSFSLSISNGEEPRYYIGKQGARARGPYEIKEGPREYSMSASVVLPDASLDANVAHASASQDGALELFRQLLLEGDYGGSTAAAARAGFTASIRFDKGVNDYIIFDIPSSTTPGTPIAGNNQINSQGIFINSAPHSITTDNPFQVDLDMIFRGLQITIVDSEPVYP